MGCTIHSRKIAFSKELLGEALGIKEDFIVRRIVYDNKTSAFVIEIYQVRNENE